jgi:hypothetical protein
VKHYYGTELEARALNELEQPLKKNIEDVIIQISCVRSAQWT